MAVFSEINNFCPVCLIYNIFIPKERSNRALSKKMIFGGYKVSKSKIYYDSAI